MPVDEQTYKRLKREVETAKDESQRAQGALDALKDRLKDEFGCEDLKEAKRLLDELEGKTEKAEREFEKALTEYDKKWKAEKEED